LAKPKNAFTSLSRNKALLVILAVTAVSGIVLFYTNTHKPSTATDTVTLKHTDDPKTDVGGSNSGDTATSNDSSTGSSSGTSSGSQTNPTQKGEAPTSSGGSAGASSASLPAPTGQLLNKQKLSLKATDPKMAPIMESVCQAISDATCEIRATSSQGTIKSIGQKPTGSGFGATSLLACLHQQPHY
jgi:hypothetical protein